MLRNHSSTHRGCLSTNTLSILTLSGMTLSKVSFSDIFRNDYLDHFDTFGENFDFGTHCAAHHFEKSSKYVQQHVNPFIGYPNPSSLCESHGI